MTFSRDSLAASKLHIQPSILGEEAISDLQQIDSYLSRSAERLRNLMKTSVVISEANLSVAPLQEHQLNRPAQKEAPPYTNKKLDALRDKLCKLQENKLRLQERLGLVDKKIKTAA